MFTIRDLENGEHDRDRRVHLKLGSQWIEAERFFETSVRPAAEREREGQQKRRRGVSQVGSIDSGGDGGVCMGCCGGGYKVGREGGWRSGEGIGVNRTNSCHGFGSVVYDQSSTTVPDVGATRASFFDLNISGSGLTLRAVGIQLLYMTSTKQWINLIFELCI